MAPRSPSPELRPLLNDSPPSYNTVTPPDAPIEVKKVSKVDLTWILAGLWSAIFLGALDGLLM